MTAIEFVRTVCVVVMFGAMLLAASFDGDPNVPVSVGLTASGICLLAEVWMLLFDIDDMSGGAS